jgi:hypothetical protein
MDEDAQRVLDEFKRADGIVDFYRVLDLQPNATQDYIEMAHSFFSATYHPKTGCGSKDAPARYALTQQALHTLGDPERRKKYDAYLRYADGGGHAKLLSVLEAAKPEVRLKAIREQCRRRTRAWIVASILWVVAVQLWGVIWRWDYNLTENGFLALNLSLPLLSGLAWLGIRWIGRN